MISQAINRERKETKPKERKRRKGRERRREGGKLRHKGILKGKKLGRNLGEAPQPGL